jgi:histidinol-phosphate aminotransferase
MTATALDSLPRRSVIGVGPYVPGASAAEVKARFGRDHMTRLNWNENLFGPLPGVLEETAAQLPDVWKYPEEAYDELRAALAQWAGAGVEQVIPGHGIQALTLAVIATFVEPGDAVIVPWPTYGLYAQACAVAGARVVRVKGPTEGPGALALDLPAIAAAAVAHRAKLAFVCDPNNPTGLRLDRADWDTFLDVLPPGCLAVADEAYRDYVEPADRIDRVADIRAGRPVIVLRTFSKIFGLAGLRLGYLLAHASLTSHLNAVQEPFNVNQAALSAGLASLRRTELLEPRRDQARVARAILREPLAQHGIHTLPSDANFVLLDLQDDDVRVADTLAAREGILVRAGSEFGLPGYARVTTADEELMELVGERIAATVRR